MCRLVLSVLALSILSTAPASAASETVLYSFCSQRQCEDGMQPVRNGLVRDSAGNIYGTTYNAGPNQGGEVFKLTPGGVLTVPLAFPDQYGGGGPIGGLVSDAAGNLYGATQDHVFKLAPDGSETLLHLFESLLQSGVSIDKNANLYGASFDGGIGNDGFVFRISSEGKYKILHAFNGADGAAPQSAPIVDRHGNLFGVTPYGGSDNCPDGCGIVYEISRSGDYKVLYAFTGGDDGSPFAGLAIDALGNLYGTTATGGNYGCGTVFKIAADGTEAMLHSFSYNADNHDGCDPVSQPVLDKKGNIYGTTRQGGDFGRGTVFEITASGKEKVLYAFGNAPDGTQPDGRLLADPRNGLYYGTTVGGGTNGWGTVYELSTHR